MKHWHQWHPFWNARVLSNVYLEIFGTVPWMVP